MKTFHFLSGLPRSGSTVLSAILSQRPDTFCTPTSPLLDQIVANQNIWHANQCVIANPIPAQLDNITREIIARFWDFVPQPIIIDKNRGWTANMITAEILFKKPMKMIATVRDLPSIMASWLTLLRKNAGGKMDVMIYQRGLKPTDENRLNIMMAEMVQSCIDGMNRGLREAPTQIHLVEYDDLVSDPATELKKIEDFLELEPHQYDFNNIQSPTKDDDLTAWGLNGMHTINSTLKKTSKPAIEILGSELFEKYNYPWRENV